MGGMAPLDGGKLVGSSQVGSPLGLGEGEGLGGTVVQVPAQVQVTCWALMPRTTPQPMAWPVAVSSAEAQPPGQVFPSKARMQ